MLFEFDGASLIDLNEAYLGTIQYSIGKVSPVDGKVSQRSHCAL